MLLCDTHQVIWQMMKHYPYRGRIGIKQYNPTKPTEMGYAGKPNNVGSNEASKFYVIGRDEYKILGYRDY